MNSRLNLIWLVRCRSSLASTQGREHLNMNSQVQQMSTAASSSPAQALAMKTTGAFRSPCASSWHVLQQHYRCQTRSLAQALQAEQRQRLITCRTAVADAPVAEDADFLAPASVSYQGLGLHPAVQEALQRAGYSRPAQVQVSPQEYGQHTSYMQATLPLSPTRQMPAGSTHGSDCPPASSSAR